MFSEGFPKVRRLPLFIFSHSTKGSQTPYPMDKNLERPKTNFFVKMSNSAKRRAFLRSCWCVSWFSLFSQRLFGLRKKTTSQKHQRNFSIHKQTSDCLNAFTSDGRNAVFGFCEHWQKCWLCSSPSQSRMCVHLHCNAFAVCNGTFIRFFPFFSIFSRDAFVTNVLLQNIP